MAPPEPATFPEIVLLTTTGEPARDVQADVGLEQRGADLPNHLGDVLLGDLPAPAKPAENAA